MSREAAVLLVLLSGFLHAGWNWAVSHYGPRPGGEGGGENGGGEVSVYRVFLWGNVYALVFVAVTGQWPVYDPRWMSGEALAGVGVLAYVLGLQAAYRLATVGPVYNLSRATAALVGIPLAALWLGERWHGAGLLGVALAVVSMVGLRPPGSGGGALKAAALSLVTGLAIGGYNTGFKMALGGGLGPVQAQLLMMILPSLASLYLLIKRREALWRPLDAAAGFVSWLSFLLFLWGMTRLGAGESIVLRNGGLFFAEALDQFSQRRFNSRRLAFSLLLVAALALVAWRPGG